MTRKYVVESDVCRRSEDARPIRVRAVIPASAAALPLLSCLLLPTDHPAMVDGVAPAHANQPPPPPQNNSHNIVNHTNSNTSIPQLTASQQKTEMIADEDPLLISQSLTYVTDDGSILHSFESAPFSMGFKIQFVLIESIFVLLMVAAVPVGAHGTVVGVAIGNLLVLAYFWYNLVRSVDVTADGTLRFWIGNIEVDVPFDKIVSIRRVASSMPCSLFVTAQPYRGFLSTPTDGVAIVTTVPSTPFWLWPRSAGKPERTCCFGAFSCPRLTVVFSPTGGGNNFIRVVETEMQHVSAGRFPPATGGRKGQPKASQADYLDV